MGNKTRERKRQKIKGKADDSKLANDMLLEDNSLKGQEELQLEAVLFGKASKQPTQGKSTGTEATNELEHLMDTDLFFVDDNAPLQPPPVHTNLDGSVRGHSDEESEEVAEPVASTSTLNAFRASRASAWHDPADANLKVRLTEHKQRRKLRSTAEEDQLDGTRYEANLRDYYTKINPAPQWAVDAKNKVLHRKTKRRRSSSGSTDAAPEDFVETIMGTSSGELLDSKIEKKRLSSGVLSIERLRDANHSSRSQGSLHSLEFHPNPNVPVLFTAAGDRRLRLFNIDGHTNPHLQTVHIPSLPITGATFHPSGASILTTGPRPFYYSFDLQSGKSTRSAVKSVTSNNGDLSMEIRQFSPHGDLLAVAGKNGYIHLLDWTSSGGEQVVASLRSNSPITALAWTHTGNHLLSLGKNSEVLVWDIAARQCLTKFADDGGYGSTHMALAKDSCYLSIGSTSGFVNVYDTQHLTSNVDAKPKLMKSLGNLTTPVTSLLMNQSCEILSLASSAKKNQLRLIHLPTLTAFSNWPTAGTPLGSVNVTAFSPSSQFISLGNSQGQALLYSLRHYSDI